METATGGPPPAAPGASNGNKKRARFKPVLLEVAGAMDDAKVSHITNSLRKLRNRYLPIMRTIFTLVASNTPEAVIFGDVGNNNNVNNSTAMFTSPVGAVTANKTEVVVDRLQTRPSSCAEHEHFMLYRFLTLALTHNLAEEEMSADKRAHVQSHFILRHYVHESTRTASFLIGDTASGTCIIIDPLKDIAPYVEDMQQLHLSLTHIVVTHCFVDVALGVRELCSLYRERAAPMIEVISGLPLQPAGTSVSCCMGSYVALRAVAVPSFSPDCLVVELHLHGVLVALFTGVVLGTDAVPRSDFFEAFSGDADMRNNRLPLNSFMMGAGGAAGEHYYTPYGASTDAMAVAQSNLKTFVYDAYLNQQQRSDSSTTVMNYDRVIIFPSHGGYSNVTHQLDLCWAIHVGDLRRMHHCKVVVKTMTNASEFVAYNKKLPPLPRPPLFHATRQYNIASILQQQQQQQSPASISDAQVVGSVHLPPLIVDVRDAPDNYQLHVKGSLCVPMSFPAHIYGAKRAELWLQCLILPHQPMVIICGDPSRKVEISTRMSLIAPTSRVTVVTMPELLPLVGGTPLWSAAAAMEAYAPQQSAGEQQRHGEFTAPLLAGLENVFVGSTMSFVFNRNSLDRLVGAERLSVLDISPSAAAGSGRTLVVDVRTAYEFKNGSHQLSVHIPLSDLCARVTEDTLRGPHDATANGQPSRELGMRLLRELHASAVVTATEENTANTNTNSSNSTVATAVEDIDRVVLYCAGGYRSLIAAAILRRAFESSSSAGGGDAAHKALDKVDVIDVPGGAFQIMTQRPDLWQVKDRSIICIS